MIVKGHGRLEAAKRLGRREAPVEFQDYESEAAELADLLADNKIAELASIDTAAAWVEPRSDATTVQIKRNELILVAVLDEYRDLLKGKTETEAKA